MNLPNHLFVSSSDGALYDTRVANWSALPPLRANYYRHSRAIESAADLKAALRAGQYAWPGGYQLYFVMADGEALSFDAARAELRQLLDAIAHGSRFDGWRPVSVEINYEDSDLVCAHSGKPIPAAYDSEEESSNG